MGLSNGNWKSITKQKKQLFLDTYKAGEPEKTFCPSVAHTCIVCGITTRSYEHWMKEDPEFRAAIITLNKMFLERVERKVDEKIAAGHDEWMWRYLKNRGGWREDDAPSSTMSGSLRLEVVSDIITGPKQIESRTVEQIEAPKDEDGDLQDLMDGIKPTDDRDTE